MAQSADHVLQRMNWSSSYPFLHDPNHRRISLQKPVTETSRRHLPHVRDHEDRLLDVTKDGSRTRALLGFKITKLLLNTKLFFSNIMSLFSFGYQICCMFYLSLPM